MHQPAESDDDIEAANPYSILYDSDDTDIPDTQCTSIDNSDYQGTPTARVTRSGRATTPPIMPTYLTQELQGLKTSSLIVLIIRSNLTTTSNRKGKVIKKPRNKLHYSQSLHFIQSCQVIWTQQGSMTPILPLILRREKVDEVKLEKNLQIQKRDVWER